MSTSPPPIEVQYDGSISLPELDLWLDPHGSKPRAFVSHAHSDHFARHREIFCTPATSDIIAARYGHGSARMRRIEFGDAIEDNGFRIRLLPAGHVLGSAQIHVTRLEDGASLLFSGDFKLQPGLSCETAETAKADTLILETTFGVPRYRFPPVSELVPMIHSWVNETLAAGEVPVLLGYSMGKAQEILAIMKGAGVEILLHESVYRMTQVYEHHLGAELFPEYGCFEHAEVAGKVIICPPGAVRSKLLQSVSKRKLAIFSGWATDARAKYRYRADESFPLSDHADYPDLLRYVDAVDPQRVFTMHGTAAEFARDLRELGRDAWALTKEEQMDLGLKVIDPKI